MSDRKRKERGNGNVYKYKEAFSLRDEIGTWPNIEIKIDVMDESPFLLDHTMLKKKIRH